jgi:hypothetical protein
MKIRFFPVFFGILRGFFTTRDALANSPPGIAASSPHDADTVIRIAEAFARSLKKALGIHNLEIIDIENRRHRSKDPDYPCVTTEYCDANEYMNDAFLEVFDRDVDIQSEDDRTLWDAAWKYATLAGFARLAVRRPH